MSQNYLEKSKLFSSCPALRLLRGDTIAIGSPISNITIDNNNQCEIIVHFSFTKKARRSFSVLFGFLLNNSGVYVVCICEK